MKNLSIVISVVVFVAASLLVVVSDATHADDLHWTLYKRQFNKDYGNRGEDSMRRAIFLQNKQKIERHNAEFAAKLGYRMAFNHLADWTSDELARPRASEQDVLRMEAKQEMFSRQENQPEFLKKMLEVDVKDLPKEVDWRRVAGRVGPIKDEGWCLATWAFATTGLLEGQQYRFGKNTSELVPLSEQDLIDCSSNNFGCEGGFVDDALEDLSVLGGIPSERDYPYVIYYKRHDDKNCTYKPSESVMSVKGSLLLDRSEETLMKVVAQYGPVATGMYRTDDLIFYEFGVFFDPHCSNKLGVDTLPVLVIGYGTDKLQGDYWLVKNSWGKDFGLDGFFKIARNQHNHCGIANYATIAVF